MKLKEAIENVKDMNKKLGTYYTWVAVDENKAIYTHSYKPKYIEGEWTGFEFFCFMGIYTGTKKPEDTLREVK